jgi:TPR repeat protein
MAICGDKATRYDSRDACPEDKREVTDTTLGSSDSRYDLEINRDVVEEEEKAASKEGDERAAYSNGTIFQQPTNYDSALALVVFDDKEEDSEQAEADERSNDIG